MLVRAIAGVTGMTQIRTENGIQSKHYLKFIVSIVVSRKWLDVM